MDASVSTQVAALDRSGPGGKKLYSSVVNAAKVKSEDKAQMYLLMREYYANMTEEQFITDLREKNDVILLRDRHGEIRGFSTLLQTEVNGPKGKVRTIFSGDTIVAREYWGQKALGMAFLKYLFTEKMKKPFVPLYWMLMSKGYKTYLLMANNFRHHYPRFEKPTPAHIQTVMNDFYGTKFATSYDADRGLIRVAEESCHLREGVAPVTEELCRKLPRVNFFANRNPRWKEGVELACIAEMNLYMPLYYFVKKTLLRSRKAGVK